jgi:hypothetical protein
VLIAYLPDADVVAGGDVAVSAVVGVLQNGRDAVIVSVPHVVLYLAVLVDALAVA